MGKRTGKKRKAKAQSQPEPVMTDEEMEAQMKARQEQRRKRLLAGVRALEEQTKTRLVSVPLSAGAIDIGFIAVGAAWVTIPFEKRPDLKSAFTEPSESAEGPPNGATEAQP